MLRRHRLVPEPGKRRPKIKATSIRLWRICFESGQGCQTASWRPCKTQCSSQCAEHIRRCECFDPERL